MQASARLRQQAQLRTVNLSCLHVEASSRTRPMVFGMGSCFYDEQPTAEESARNKGGSLGVLKHVPQ